MSRIMALDWGERRVGIALSDETGTIASPYGVLARTSSLDRDLRSLANLVREREVGLVLVGVPFRLDGGQGPAAQAALGFIERLRQILTVPVREVDERMSTAGAERALLEGDVSRRRRRDLVDQVAAALFLQAYLDGVGRERR